MYNLVIITKYNAILLIVDDINDEEVQEILSQRWVIDAKWWKIMDNGMENGPFKRLVKKKNDTQSDG